MNLERVVDDQRDMVMELWERIYRLQDDLHNVGLQERKLWDALEARIGREQALALLGEEGRLIVYDGRAGARRWRPNLWEKEKTLDE